MIVLIEGFAEPAVGLRIDAVVNIGPIDTNENDVPAPRDGHLGCGIAWYFRHLWLLCCHSGPPALGADRANKACWRGSKRQSFRGRQNGAAANHAVHEYRPCATHTGLLLRRLKWPR